MRVTREEGQEFTVGKIRTEKVEPIIRESWRRSIAYGVKPYQIERMISYSKEELKNALEKNEKLLEVAEPYIQNVFAILHDMKGINISLLDDECYILKLWTDDSKKRKFMNNNLRVGVCWKEEYMGTNAPGTALYLNGPILIDGEEHYIKAYYKTTCLAAPIHNPEGDVLGILSIDVAMKEYNKSLFAMLITAVQGIERELHHISYQEKIENLNDSLEKYIKKEKQLKKELREKAELLEAIVDNMYEGLVVYDQNGKCLTANKAIHDLLGLNNGQLLNREYGNSKKYGVVFKDEKGKEIPFKDYHPPRILRGEKIKNEVVTAENGTLKRHMMGNGFPLLDEDGNIKHTIMCYTNITKLKKREMEIKKQEEFIRKVLNLVGTPSAVIRYPDLTYEISNRKNDEIVGKLRNEKKISLVGKSFEDPQSRARQEDLVEIVKKVGETGKEAFIQGRLYESIEKYYNFIFSPIFNEVGKTSHVIMVVIDVTDEIIYNKKMEQMAEKKDEFFSIVSHELRSPVAIINLATQMLLSSHYQQQLSPSAKELVNKIRQNSYRLLRLINNFLDITKIEEGFIHMNYTNTDIVQLSKNITESLQLLAGNKEIRLFFHSKMEEEIIQIDRDQYERILLNLLSNAFKFTPSHREIHVHIGKKENYVTVEVQDQGIGIPKDQLEQIFDRFVQVDSSLSRKSEGSGIGLSLVKVLVEKMEGWIEVASCEGEGSCFTIFLPDKIYPEKEVAADPLKLPTEMTEVINIEFADVYA